MSIENAANGFPYTLCAGIADTTGGVAAVLSSSFGIAAASVTRTGKGTISIVLAEKPVAASFYPLLSVNSPNTAVSVSSYTAGTGTLILQGTDLANAAAEVSCTFEIRMVQNT